ncbi:LAMI_0G13674g1_1 [Lachancea mirantina]|uniref:LAMI_0G13674g1_1 n=1 Tax=Lachancea mirantina TaxID=1230905 RepID=A0A1G4KBX8_9SACH|nr:LAMI_0G13674g1_1 [Lachancea mirantina]
MTRQQARIVPWRSRDEIELVKTRLYSWKYGAEDARERGVMKVECWESRGPYTPHVILTTARLVQLKLMDESGNLDGLTMRMAYAMALIRFVNGLLDPTQQSQFAIPLHVLAERLQLPSWFVELRHCSTHERDLPSLEMLRLACSEALEWLWRNYWDAEEMQLKDEMKEEGNREVDGQGEISEASELRNGAQRFIEALPAVARILNSDVHVGKRQRVSSSFTGGVKVVKKARNEPSPEEKIEQFVGIAKEAWKLAKKGPDIFISEFVKQYDVRTQPLVLRLLAERINVFSYELCRWILQEFDITVQARQMTVLRRTFSKSQLDKFVTQLCDHALDYRKVFAHCDRWSQLLRQHPSYLGVTILQRTIDCTKVLPEKLQKRYANEIAKIKDQLTRVATRASPSELNLYDIVSLSIERPKESHVTQTPSTATMASTAADAVLDDLAKLRKREQRPLLWQSAPVWTPRPFGTI